MTHRAAEGQGEIADAGGDEEGNWLIPETIRGDFRFSARNEWRTSQKKPA